MKTIIYVDGFNFYYGRLKYSSFKWLDIFKLFSEQIIAAQCPEAQVIKIKYFTADIKSNFASHGQLAQKSQNDYLRALELSYPDQLEIIKGYYSASKANLPAFKKPPNKKDQAAVWKLEEKQTDVNIAIHLFCDVMKAQAEQIVLVSNDTDLETALAMIRKEFGQHIKIGIVIPAPKLLEKKRRPSNQRLSQYADWTRHYILDDELEQSQLPKQIATNKKPIIKPNYW
jgi:uncharacterized LabA/DUF88 family protein